MSVSQFPSLKKKTKNKQTSNLLILPWSTEAGVIYATLCLWLQKAQMPLKAALSR